MDRRTGGFTHIGLRLANAAAYLAMTGGATVALAMGRFESAVVGPFTPAGVSLPAWLLIYLCLGAFTAVQIARPGPYVERIGWLFVLASLANLAWLPLEALGRSELAFGALVLQLVSLAGVYVRLFIGRSTGSAMEKWVVHVAFSLCLGWITVTAVAAGAALLLANGVGGPGQGPWALVTVIVWALAALLVLARRGDPFYALSVALALVGILATRSGRPEQGGPTAAAIAALALMAALGVLRARKYLSY